MTTTLRTTQGGWESVSPAPPAFEFHTTQHEGVTVLVFEGELEDEDRTAFREVLFQSIESGEPNKAPTKNLMLDLGAVTFLSEQSISVLVEALRA
jgi:anti-anti-sigma factor